MIKKVLTMGLGYIGLPTSALIASSKINVLGIDINKDVVDTINKGKIHIVEKDLEKIVAESVKSGFLKASLEIATADVYLIVVPTPFKNNYEPDISFIESATKRIIPFLKENDLFIIESTSPVGTTEKIMNLIYEKRKDLNINPNFCCVFLTCARNSANRLRFPLVHPEIFMCSFRLCKYELPEFFLEKVMGVLNFHPW